MCNDILNAIFQMVDLKKRTPSAQRKQLMEMFNLSEYEINQYIRTARQQMNISLRSQEEKQDWIIANIDLSKSTSQSDIELVAHMCGIQRNTAITYIANALARMGISVVQETKEIYDIIKTWDLSKPIPEKDKQELAEKFNTHPDNIDYFIANSRAKLGISFRQNNKEKEETFMLQTFGRNFKRTFTKTDITRIAKALGIDTTSVKAVVRRYRDRMLTEEKQRITIKQAKNKEFEQISTWRKDGLSWSDIGAKLNKNPFQLIRDFNASMAKQKVAIGAVS